VKTPWETEQEHKREGFARIVFEVEPDENGYPSAGTRERVWAVPIADGYRLDSIPWYARLVAYDDIVTTTERDGQLFFAGVILASGHSTIRVIMSDKQARSSLRDAGASIC
jgi:Domain of unknown function (DUF4265)